MNNTIFDLLVNDTQNSNFRQRKNQRACLLSLWVSTLLFLAGCPEPGAENTKKETRVESGTDVNTDADTDAESDTDSEVASSETEVYLDTADTAEEDTASDSDSDSEPETTSDEDQCPDDPKKTRPGQCGCGNSDADSDLDGKANCADVCPSDPNKTDLGQCGCGVRDPDSDGDGTANCNDYCPRDPAKRRPGICGCGNSDVDSDGDGAPDCKDQCPDDPTKTEPGSCGCGVVDATADSDGDGVRDCDDGCPMDPDKLKPGMCGCGAEDDSTDTDQDGVLDCNDDCPSDPEKTQPLVCGCGETETDADEDGALDCIDACPHDPQKTSAGVCGCGVADSDSDENGIPDCNELPIEYVDGLKRTHLVRSGDQDVFDTEVCQELTYRWFNDKYLRIRERSFGFAYYEGETPCEEIGPFDRWMSIFEGYLSLSLADGAQTTHGVEFAADVNDGVRLVLLDPESQEEICRMELWQDVPEYDNYHSTDGYPENYGCETLLTAGVYYPMKLEVYHQGDQRSSNSLFNRAYLDMFYWGLPSGASISFFRPGVGLPVTSG